MFGYGFLAVVLVLYLEAAGLDPLAVGVVLTLTLIGDTVISLWLTTHADRLGRRRVLVAGAALMVIAGVVVRAHAAGCRCSSWPARSASSHPPATRSDRSSPIEQAALSQTVPDARRTPTFAWYNLVGYVATATGALAAGLVSQALLDGGAAPRRCLPRDRGRYALIGVVHGRRRSGARRRARGAAPSDASDDGIRRRFGLDRSKAHRRSASRPLFSLDAFAGGFIPQSLLAYWFHLQFGVEPAVLGAHLLRGEPAGGGLVAVGSAGSRPGSGSSTRWSSPTCRRTCC